MALSLFGGSGKRQLRNLARNIIRPLKNGLHSFIWVLETLVEINEETIYSTQQIYSDIRERIEHMNEQLQESQEIALNELHSIDRNTESLTAELSRLTNQKTQKKSELWGLKKKLETHESSLEDYRESLKTEERNLEKANDTLASMRQKKKDAEAKVVVGAILLPIPVAGWIVGGTLIGVGLYEIDQAIDAVKDAKEKVSDCESEIERYSDKVSKYKSKICQAKEDIQNADERISDAEDKLRAVSAKRKVVADVQHKIRRAVVQLGQVCSVGSAAELQTRCLIALEPIMKVMEEMTTALGQITGDDLLHTQGIPSLMYAIRQNHTMLMGCQRQPINSDWGAENYY